MAVNLAISLAKKGKKVALLDGDLRHPSVALSMGIRTKKYGIADVLNKKTDLKSVMLRYGEYELDILPGKEMVKNPTELIGNGYLERLLKVLRKNYDYVIVDTPPCGMLSDASAIARMTDGAVMVVQNSERSRKYCRYRCKSDRVCTEWNRDGNYRLWIRLRIWLWPLRLLWEKRMKRKKINYQLLLRRVCLIVLDIFLIILSSLMALATRFEFDVRQIPEEFFSVLLDYGVLMIFVTLIVFGVFRIYSSLWEYAGLEETFKIIGAVVFSSLCDMGKHLPRSYYVIRTFYLIALVGGSRFFYRLIRLRYRKRQHYSIKKKKKIMLIGAGEAGRTLIQEIQNSRYLDQKICCVIDDNRRKIGRYILGIRVVGDRNAIKRSVEHYGIEQIIIAIPSAGSRKIRPILEICKDTGCELKILPGVYQLVNGEVNVSKLRPVNIEDLLGLEEINVNIDEIMDYVCSKTILVTGGGGSIGSELCRQIAAHKPERLIIFDIYENNAYDIQQELKMKYPTD